MGHAERAGRKQAQAHGTDAARTQAEQTRDRIARPLPDPLDGIGGKRTEDGRAKSRKRIIDFQRRKTGLGGMPQMAALLSKQEAQRQPSNVTRR
jgi:hypothetical protein